LFSSPTSYSLLSSSRLPLPPFFYSTATSPSDIYTLSLHDALPIFWVSFIFVLTRSSFILSMRTAFMISVKVLPVSFLSRVLRYRSEEHTSELQSRFDLVCRLLLEKKKRINLIYKHI